MKKQWKASVPHHAREIEELRADRELALQYLKAAMQELDDPNNRAAGLLALRALAEAYGGLAAIAAQAGIRREALYRSLSPKGNPTLKTLLAVLKAVGMRLSVEPERIVHASRPPRLAARPPSRSTRAPRSRGRSASPVSTGPT